MIKELWKRYGKLQVLCGLNLVVEPGETLVILGRSGVGKSVLLKQILGLERPDQGTVQINGDKVSHLEGEKLHSATRMMGMLFQGAALFDSMTVEENVGFYLTEHGNPVTGKKFPREEVEERVREALAMVGLEGNEKAMPSDLSGGMKKRAGLARLIVYRPEVILYDEPTTGMDPVTANQINELIVKTQQELKSTSIVVTHDIRSALMVGDRIAMLENGKIASIFTPDQFEMTDDPLVRLFVDNSRVSTARSPR